VGSIEGKRGAAASAYRSVNSELFISVNVTHRDSRAVRAGDQAGRRTWAGRGILNHILHRKLKSY